MSALDAQFGSAEESTFGTIATPTRFDEFVSESIEATYGRIESNGLRAGRLYRSDTRFTTYPIGAAGDVELEVTTKSFAFWLRQMVGGTPVTTGTATGYTHTFTPASLTGRSFTAQVGRPDYVGAPVRPFTYAGGKVGSWELSNKNDGNLLAKLSVDFISEVTSTALATASFPTAVETFNWVGGSVTVGGTAFDVMDVSLSGDNAIATDRRYLRSNAVKKEQVGDDFRGGKFKMKADFDGFAQRDRVASASAAGATAMIVLKWQGSTPIAGGAILPSLTLTVNGRFDKFAANVAGPASLTQSIEGVYLGVNGLSIAYVTADSTTLL